MNIKVTYFLLVALLAFGCEKIPDQFAERENSVNINTSWDMITVEPTPKKCVVVFRDSNDNYVKSHEIYSPRDIDTLRDGEYTSYSYYVKDDVFSIQNIENFKETQFVVEADQNGFIPTKSELYVSNSSNFDVLFFRPSGTLNQRMRAEFTVVETEVIFVGGSNASGINSCDVTLDNVFNTYDIYTRSVVKDALKKAKASLTQTENNKFFGRAYYLGFDPTNGNTLTIDLKTANGNTGTIKTDMANKLSTFTQKIRLKIYLYCNTSSVSNGKFTVELQKIDIQDAETIVVE